MYEELKDLLVSELLIDAADIKPESELVADLDATDINRFVTVKDIVAYFEEKKAGKK